MRKPQSRPVALVLALLSLLGCGRDQAPEATSQPLVIAAIGEPPSVLPPLVDQSVGRDISDQVYERLADLPFGKPTIDEDAYRPRLARRWERIDSVTWRFHLDGHARWSDGRPVTAEDVAFSFAAFSNTLLPAPAGAIIGTLRVDVEDSLTIRITFPEPYPEQLYDATWHVRILPRHVWNHVPLSAWGRDTTVARLVGSGPYRVVAWQRGQYLRLEARPDAEVRTRTLIWRFAADPEAALNLLLSHEADAMELNGPPALAARVREDSVFQVVSYPSAAYGFLAFNFRRGGGRAAVLGDRSVRQALTLAVDRTALVQATFGPEAVAPPGPLSRHLWLWRDRTTTVAYDTAAAARLLDGAGWRRSPDGVRRRGGAPLRFDILFPSTSGARRALAQLLQEAWRQQGIQATLTAVDFPVFQERLAAGRFDTYLGAYLDEPSPRGLRDQWSRSGWAALNYGHYAHPQVDALLERAGREADPTRAAAAYWTAFDSLNADGAAIFLYTPVSAAAVRRDIGQVEVNPYSWLSGVGVWQPAPIAAEPAVEGAPAVAASSR